ncbi:MAG: hypothetical protein IT424_05810 [Pirellulales bacterium]|nr:hypothetical protein [Pirellulales bacterium]
MVCVSPLLATSRGVGDDDFERAPIEYSKSTPDNRVSRLQAKLDDGECELSFDAERGYLPALLEALHVPVESQMLVFSKTSLQRRRISPRTPRAIYFNDDVYVGFCRAGEVLEVSAADPKLGTVFYTLEQRQADVPRLVRQTDSCLVCHSSSRTEGVPGHLARSVSVGPSGEPILSAGSAMVDYRTPIAERWGGWYVTGTHGGQKHLGNLILRGGKSPTDEQQAAAQNVTGLESRFKVGQYLAPHSDIVALMVLEHQTLMHNRLTKANFEARAALHYQAELNRALGQPADAPLDSTARRIQSAADDVVDALLFVEEAEIHDPIAGTSGFAEAFGNLGPKDASGRSFRQFDLRRRLFKYPCSYLIYSTSFDSLPDEVRQCVWQRLAAVLRGEDDSAKFSHLSAQDRMDIASIIRDTKSNLPADWP